MLRICRWREYLLTFKGKINQGSIFEEVHNLFLPELRIEGYDRARLGLGVFRLLALLYLPFVVFLVRRTAWVLFDPEHWLLKISPRSTFEFFISIHLSFVMRLIVEDEEKDLVWERTASLA